jgi:hypothetical protein
MALVKAQSTGAFSRTIFAKKMVGPQILTPQRLGASCWANDNTISSASIFLRAI